MGRPRVLLADNDQDYLLLAGEYLDRAGYEVVCANHPDRARAILQQEAIALAFFDYRMVDDSTLDNSGLRLALELLETYSAPIVIMTRYPDHRYVREALIPRKSGKPAVVDFIVKEDGLSRLVDALN